MTDVFAASSAALVTLSNEGELPARALAVARAAEVLCLCAHPEGTARNGALAHERHFVLHGGSAFHGSELDILLRSNQMRSVVIAGASLGRMLHDAEEARLRGYAAAILVAPGDCDAARNLAMQLYGPDAPTVFTIDVLADLWPASQAAARNWRAAAKHEQLLPTLAQRLDPAHTAYVLIDVQNDFCRLKRDESETFSIVNRALGNIDALLEAARSSGCTIVHIQAEYGPLFRSPGHPYRYPGAGPGEVVWTASASEFGVNGPLLPDAEVEVCLAGSWGEEFVGVVPAAGEIVLRKHRYSAFVDTGLDVILRNKGIKTIVLVGVATNVCVESTARDAAMRDFYVVVAEDGVGVRDAARGRHDNALAEIQGCFGMVVPAARILDIWSAAARMETAA